MTTFDEISSRLRSTEPASSGTASDQCPTELTNGVLDEGLHSSVCLCVCYCMCLCRQGCPCGLLGCKNRPAPFHGWMSYKVTQRGSVYICLSIVFFIVLLLIRTTFLYCHWKLLSVLSFGCSS